MGQVGTAKLRFATSEDKSASELGGVMPLVQNALPDSAGVMRRRPGISAWAPFNPSYASGSPVIGMAAFGQRLIYVTADRHIHSINSAGLKTELTSGNWGTELDGGGRPSMVAKPDMIALAGGGAMQKWTGSGLSARLTNAGNGVDPPSGDPPPAVSVCALAERLVAQYSGYQSEDVWWSGPNYAWENWDLTAGGGAGSMQASGKPDPTMWIADNTNELFVFGTETIQAYAPSALQIDENDPNNILDFALARTQNIGTRSPCSIVANDDHFGLIDHRKRAILTDARTYQDIGKPIYQVLRDMQSIEDAWGFRMRLGRFDCLVWMFPTDGYGLIYDTASGNWCEWRAGEVGAGPLTITSAYDWAEEGVLLVGLSDGSIAKLDDSVNADLTVSIAVKLTSGFEDHGTAAQKACRAVAFNLKRTFTALPAPTYGVSPSGHVRIKYRDNQGAWRILKDVELSTELQIQIISRSVGVYRTRQWSVEYTGRDQLELVSAEETFEILGV